MKKIHTLLVHLIDAKEFYRLINKVTMKMQILILLCLFATIIGCEEKDESTNSTNKTALIGIWVNTQFNSDTLFWEDSRILRTDTISSMYMHSYDYEVIDNNIKLKYNGGYYILVPESSFKITISPDNSLLTIAGIENYFPNYKGNQFKRLTKGPSNQL